MIYIPTELLHQENYYSYSNNDIITVYSSCNNDSCTCTDIYTNLDYNKSSTYSCTKTGVNFIDSTPTDNFYYRKDFWSILIMFIIFCFVIIWVPLKIVMRFFKRFN